MIDKRNKESKILLSDYDYKKDVKNRVLISSLNTVELDIMREILDGSLKCMIPQLISDLGLSKNDFKLFIEKFQASGLFRLQGDCLHVDREMRKYYEMQLLRFEGHFEPDLNFFQKLLNHLPIHLLPNWYAIPSTSSHIIKAIIETHLWTPKLFEDYLKKLSFENEVLRIIQEIWSANDYKVNASDLKQKQGFTQEKLEEHLLLLEYSLVCSFRYERNGNHWEQVVVPFREWRNYQLFKKAAVSKSIPGGIQRRHLDDFGFILELNDLLKQILSDDSCSSSLANLQRKDLVEILVSLGLVAVDRKGVCGEEKPAEAWFRKPIQDQAASVYSCLLKQAAYSPYTERDIREIERGLKPFVNGNWIYFDDFWLGFTAPIGKTSAVQLQNKGRWDYALPAYSEADCAFVRRIFIEMLYPAGRVALGTYANKLCFCVTPFGRKILGD